MLQFPRLFGPGQIGRLALKNRIVMAPMGTRLAKEGAVTDQQIDYYVERAHGGVSLIIIECAYIRPKPGRPCVSHDIFFSTLVIVHFEALKTKIGVAPWVDRVNVAMGVH